MKRLNLRVLRLTPLFLLVVGVSALVAQTPAPRGQQAQGQRGQPPAGQAARAQDEPFPPHRIADNLFYVGSKDYGSFLITTSEGLILINSSYERTVPFIRGSIEKLGYKFSDVKILLTSHAHVDHVAGTAEVVKQTGAKVYVMDADEEIVRTGGEGDFNYNVKWPPARVDHILHDKEEVKLGAAVLVANKTPGHTKGCTSWSMKVTDGGKTYNAVIICSISINNFALVNNAKYPSIADDYRQTFKALKAMPVDIYLGAHPNVYGLAEKYARLEKGATENVFVDPKGFTAFIERGEKSFNAEFEKQRAAAASAGKD